MLLQNFEIYDRILKIKIMKTGIAMNVYDFDKTIYDGDSTEDFIIMCLKKQPRLIFRFIRCGISFAAYRTGLVSKTAFKEVMYRFLRDIDNIDDYVQEFWDSHIKKIKKFYIANQKADDVIISASPEFLLRDVCQRLGIKHLIASKIDKYTGCCLGINCFGEEKVRRFYTQYSSEHGRIPQIDEFYSDSLSDAPLAKLAKHAYIVVGEDTVLWNAKNL